MCYVQFMNGIFLSTFIITYRIFEQKRTADFVRTEISGNNQESSQKNMILVLKKKKSVEVTPSYKLYNIIRRNAITNNINSWREKTATRATKLLM